VAVVAAPFVLVAFAIFALYFFGGSNFEIAGF
jgi:hypothetical protein